MKNCSLYKSKKASTKCGVTWCLEKNTRKNIVYTKKTYG